MISVQNQQINKIKLSKAERKAIHDKKVQDKLDAFNDARRKEMFDFTDEQKAIGNLTKGFNTYYLRDHETFKPIGYAERHEIFKKFPEQFQKCTFPEIFNFTHWIGIDVNDTTFNISDEFPDGVSIGYNYDPNDEEMKAKLHRHIMELGERSNPQLMVFHKDHPETVHSVKINIWSTPTAFDYWFRIEFRPNRIYLTDYDGFKIFDFELNLLFFKPILVDSDVYGFAVDRDNWNNVKFWSMNQAYEITGTDHDSGARLDYNDITGVESIAQLVIT